MTHSSHYIVLCTCPDQATAQTIGTALVEQQLAACVNIIPSLISIYRWEAQVTQDTECLMTIKTTESCYSRLESAIAQLHPYQTPQIVALPLHAGLRPYLDWIDQCCD